MVSCGLNMRFFTIHVNESFDKEIDNNYFLAAMKTISTFTCCMSFLWTFLFIKFGWKKTYATLNIIVICIDFIAPIIVLDIEPMPGTSAAMMQLKNIVYMISNIVMSLCNSG